MLLGNYTGDLFWFNLRTGEQDSTTSCHHSAITSIQQSIVVRFLKRYFIDEK